MKRFADLMFDYHRAESDFTDALCDAGLEDWGSIGGDWYDGSLELHKVPNDARLNEAVQRVIFDAGFVKVYVNHLDGWETHYSWNHSEPFKPSRGWRRRYVSDPTATTTNVIAGEPNPGYFEISYWPKGWTGPGTEKWLETGYMRIVPDPLEPPAQAGEG
jgi:hypothetical protein